MTNDYIRRQDVVDYCKALMNAELGQHTNDWGYGRERYNQTEVILDFIEHRQPADVAPVRHGHWTLVGWHKGMKVVECSCCKKRAIGATEFCPNCGAKMDGKRREG